ncbi:MAG: Holliday junction DNA helicase RuvA [Planctomycetota bacterium]|jgi:Holliday junction DNA helicase RuvA
MKKARGTVPREHYSYWTRRLFYTKKSGLFVFVSRFLHTVVYMIGYINGTLVGKTDRDLIILTGGIGYSVATTSSLLISVIGDTMALWTHLQVRDSALELYGFETMDERSVFQKLIDVSGVGPRSALAILGIAPLSSICQAITAKDTALLQRVSGIGKKTAERIVIELSDKLPELADTPSTNSQYNLEVMDTLEALGYSSATIRMTLQSLPPDIESMSDRIKAALRIINT